jgi:hypothetical protein
MARIDLDKMRHIHLGDMNKNKSYTLFHLPPLFTAAIQIEGYLNYFGISLFWQNLQPRQIEPGFYKTRIKSAADRGSKVSHL